MKIPHKQKGFTLIELLIVVTIMAILISLAAPSFTRLIRNSRVETAATGVLVALTVARNEAIRRGVHVGICAGNPAGTACNGGTEWATGWLMWTGSTSTVGGPNVGNLIKVGPAAPSVTMIAPGNMVDFDPRGMTATPGILVANSISCTSAVDKQITVELNTVGRTISRAGLCP